ncbi:MAG: YcjF family protein [bacterium]
MARQTKNQQLKDKLAASLDSTAKPPESPPKESPPNVRPRRAPQPSVPPSMSSSSETVTLQSNVDTANSVVTSSAMLAAGAGAIPATGWDMAAIAGVQLKMLSDLAKIYGVPFTENLGKTVLATTITALAPGLVAQSSFASALKVVPGLGQIMGMLAVPAYAGGLTYAVGRVFISHFESDGDLLSFNPKKFSSHLADEMKAGMKKVASVKL